MMLSRKRSVDKLKSASRAPESSTGTARLAEVSAKIDSARSSSLVRRPVFDRRLNVIAYELVAADGAIGEITIDTRSDGSHRILLNSFSELDLETFGDGKPIQLTIMSSLLSNGIPADLDPQRVALVLGAGVGVTESTQNAIADLRTRGYQIVLDDLTTNSHLHPLIRQADAVKINIAKGTTGTVEKQIAILKDSGVDLIADGVASHDELRAVTRMGFRQYQGTFLSRPDAFRKSAVRQPQIAALELITLLQDPDAEVSDIAEVIRRDVNLSYRILKVVNSASYSLPRPLGSIEEAVALVGTRQIISWVGAMSLSRASNKPTELMRTAMTRARACEMLAPMVGRQDSQRFYLVGLFSVIEALLDAPAQTTLASLPISSEISDAIVAGGGIMGEVLRGVVAFEQADWERSHIIGVDDRAVYRAFRSAVIETDDTWSAVSGV